MTWGFIDIFRAIVISTWKFYSQQDAGQGESATARDITEQYRSIRHLHVDPAFQFSKQLRDSCFRSRGGTDGPRKTGDNLSDCPACSGILWIARAIAEERYSTWSRFGCGAKNLTHDKPSTHLRGPQHSIATTVPLLPFSQLTPLYPTHATSIERDVRFLAAPEMKGTFESTLRKALHFIGDVRLDHWTETFVKNVLNVNDEFLYAKNTINLDTRYLSQINVFLLKSKWSGLNQIITEWRKRELCIFIYDYRKIIYLRLSHALKES